jgi:ubiquinone/menaquinone biosynthesis C-methylase UbiE
MSRKDSQVRAVRDFWDSRAGLGLAAGTKDLILKQLEIEAIAGHVREGMRVLDAGCGNGITAITIAERYMVDVVAFDFADEMVKTAKEMVADRQLKGSVTFNVFDIRDIPKTLGMFDLIYTERTLINLQDWQSQADAILKLTNLLIDGGLYLMCENSQDALDRLNALREQVGLQTIDPPWHNRYLIEAEIEQYSVPGVRLEGAVNFTSTYYFLSRVVNARLAMLESMEPFYDAPINQLALQLPSIGDFGQTKIWLWRKLGM